MSKFNRQVTVAVKQPLATEAQASGTTALGAPGFARDAKSELFLLAVSLMGADDRYHEKGNAARQRLTALAQTVACADLPWMLGFLPYLRDEANMRTAPVLVAADALHAMHEAGIGGGRALLPAAIRRGDEPGELMAYWFSTYGRKIPVSFARGMSDALVRVYNEYSLLKYDSREAAFRFGDVIELCRPRYHKSLWGTWREALYRYAIERRHGRAADVPDALRTIRANQALHAAAAEDPRVLLDTARLREAGMTWEATLSLAGKKVPKKELWEAFIPLLGYSALLRNLRNFDDAGVPDDIAEKVAQQIAAGDSRQLPFRFLSAHRAVRGFRWAHALEQALAKSLDNVPVLKGRTLILVDRSPSMWDQRFSPKSDMPWADAAAIFGAALALRAQDATLVQFAGDSSVVPYDRREPVLKLVERFYRGSGTDIPSAIQAHFRNHDRIVVVTDEQTRPGYFPSNMHGYYGGMPPTPVNDMVPGNVPVHMWNFAGYARGAMATEPNRFLMGGLSDASFKLIPLLEAGNDQRWEDLFRTKRMQPLHSCGVI